MVTKQTDIKNRTYYFCNDLINIKNFDPKMLKLDKKALLNNSVFYISYAHKKEKNMILIV